MNGIFLTWGRHCGSESCGCPGQRWPWWSVSLSSQACWSSPPFGTKSDLLCKRLKMNIMFRHRKYQSSCNSSSIDIYWTEWTFIIHHVFRGEDGMLATEIRNTTGKCLKDCSSHAKSWSSRPVLWTSAVPFDFSGQFKHWQSTPLFIVQPDLLVSVAVLFHASGTHYRQSAEGWSQFHRQL